MTHRNQYLEPVRPATALDASAGKLVYTYPPLHAPHAVGNNSDQEESGLLDYWGMVRRHKGAIAGFLLGGALLGFAIGLPMSPEYRAKTAIEVLNLNEDFMNMKQTSAVTTGDNTTDVSEEQTQVQVLQSDTLLNRVYAKLDPGGQLTVHKLSADQSGWRKFLHLDPPLVLTKREKKIVAAANSMKVKATPHTRIIEITVDSTDPQLATDFANTVTSEFIQENIDARWQSMQMTGTWLSRELGDARLKLQRSEAALQEYAKQSGLIFTDPDTNISNEKLQQIQQELSAATADRINKQSRFEQAQKATPDSLPEVLNDPGLRETQAKLSDLRRQVANLDATYNPEYSKNKRASAELAVLESTFREERANILDRIRNEYVESARQEKLLHESYDDQARQVTGDGEKAIQYNILKREADSNRQLYDSMLQQLKQSSIASAVRASNVRVVDAALLPDKPFSPNLKLNAIFGLLGGLLVSFAFVLLRERSDRTLQKPGELQFWTKLPELGTIPVPAVDARNGLVTARMMPLIAEGERTGRKRKSSTSESVGVVTWNHNPSLMAEAFRAVLASILFAADDGSHPRVIVVTSTAAADGKTTVVSNIGAAVAEIGRKALIIDGDLRRPNVHNLLGLSNEGGLSDILKQQSFNLELVERLVQPTRIPGLHVLTSGPTTAAAANLLYSRNLERMLARFREEYDVILIDTPPMLQMTDARVVGRLSDGVVLVARAEQTTRDAAIAARQRLEEDRIRVIGTVLTGWDPKRATNVDPGYMPTYYGQRPATGKSRWMRS